MQWNEFKSLLAADSPPSNIGKYLEALWYDGKDDWDQSHNIAQDIEDRNGSWIHAYLHRKEGDISNARYWYQRAGKPVPSYSLEKEWEELVQQFLL
jgi:hypothetical protein